MPCRQTLFTFPVCEDELDDVHLNVVLLSQVGAERLTVRRREVTANLRTLQAVPGFLASRRDVLT